jgi:hypothetical protein
MHMVHIRIIYCILNHKLKGKIVYGVYASFLGFFSAYMLFHINKNIVSYLDAIQTRLGRYWYRYCRQFLGTITVVGIGIGIGIVEALPPQHCNWTLTSKTRVEPYIIWLFDLLPSGLIDQFLTCAIALAVVHTTSQIIHNRLLWDKKLSTSITMIISLKYDC